MPGRTKAALLHLQHCRSGESVKIPSPSWREKVQFGDADESDDAGEPMIEKEGVEAHDNTMRTKTASRWTYQQTGAHDGCSDRGE